MKGRIMVVDDEKLIREQIKTKLESSGYEVLEAGGAAELKNSLAGPQPDVIVLDIKLGPRKEDDRAGLVLLPQIKKRWPETEVIVLTGQGTMEMALEAGRSGAYNFLSKPFQGEKVLNDVRCAVERKQQNEENSTLRQALETMISGGVASPIFSSAVMHDVVRTVERIAPSDVSILITGESGAGKEVIADLIHALSPRSKNKIIKINCAALPRELIESELFGSVKGAFTGAHMDREGLFRQAEGGTLLLDEISEMAVDTQSKLLRVLQDQEVRPVGGKTSYKSNCRVIATTNRKPEEAIKAAKLREDLYYRISAISIHLPPLRERREDIMPLANAFLKRFAAQANRNIRGFNPGAIERLTAFDWPGNVRQLQNEVQRAVLLIEGNEVNAADLSITSDKAESGEGTDTSFTILEGVERNAIVQMLKETDGNKLETAKRLGMGRQTLYNKIKAYGIEV